MDRELARYVTSHYCGLMTSAERRAHRHLTAMFKATGGRSDSSAQAEARAEPPHSVWLSDDPEVLRLAADGMEIFLARVAERILREHEDEVFLNYCPKCSGLTRTPKAQMCLHCGHAWRRAAPV